VGVDVTFCRRVTNRVWRPARVPPALSGSFWERYVLPWSSHDTILNSMCPTDRAVVIQLSRVLRQSVKAVRDPCFLRDTETVSIVLFCFVFFIGAILHGYHNLRMNLFECLNVTLVLYAFYVPTNLWVFRFWTVIYNVLKGNWKSW